MSFFEQEFPRKLSYGLTGGATFSTQVNLGFSGFEQRNRNWSNARNKWQVMVNAQQNGIGTVTDYDLLRSFFLVVGGQADAFRLYEPTDFSVSLASGTGILPTPGDGSTKIFQLTKTYRSGARTYTRNIKKPIMSTVVDYKNNSLANTITMYLAGVAQSGSAWSVDATTGLVTFVTAPGVGVQIAWDGQFHFPVRFNTDEFKATIGESNVAGGTALVSVTAELIEILI